MLEAAIPFSLHACSPKNAGNAGSAVLLNGEGDIWQVCVEALPSSLSCFSNAQTFPSKWHSKHVIKVSFVEGCHA